MIATVAVILLLVTPSPTLAIDCNRNGIPDGDELVSNDCNGNGIPDDCDVQDRLFGTTWDVPILLEFDVATGRGRPYLPPDFNQFDMVAGLTIDSTTGTLYGLDWKTGHLITIDTATGTGRLHAPLEPILSDIEFVADTQTMFAVSAITDQLYTIDPVTGAATVIGPLGFPDIYDIAFDPVHDTLYGVGLGTQQLVTIDTATGTATEVGVVDSLGAMMDLAFDPISETLFGATSFKVLSLIRIDTSTADHSFVGAGLSPDLGIWGMAFDPSSGLLYGSSASGPLLSIDPETRTSTIIGPLGYGGVYGTAFDPASRKLYISDINSGFLLLVDLNTGRRTPIGPIGFRHVAGLAFAGGVLYGADDFTDQLITIDVKTGSGLAVGPLGYSSANGLAYDPKSGILYGCAYDRILTIDRNTGAAKEFARISSRLDGLTYCTATDTLYGVRWPHTGTYYVIAVDPSTGESARIVEGSGQIFGLAYDQMTNVIYGFNVSYVNSGSLYALDPASGAVRYTAPPDFGSFSALAYHASTNSLFAAANLFSDPIGWSDWLIRLDLMGGPIEKIGPLGTGFVYDLSADASGKLLYASTGNDLHVVHDATAAHTLVGSPQASINGLASGIGPTSLYAVERATDELVAVDPASAATTPIGPVGFNSIMALAYDRGNGVMYGINDASDEMVVIDAATGAGASLGQTVYSRADGLTFVPGGGMDCNGNGTPDSCEMAGNDANGNLMLDECEHIADGDFDDNAGMNLLDHAALPNCLGGPGRFPAPAAPVSIIECLVAFDPDDDRDIDLADFAVLTRGFDGD